MHLDLRSSGGSRHSHSNEVSGLGAITAGVGDEFTDEEFDLGEVFFSDAGHGLLGNSPGVCTGLSHASGRAGELSRRGECGSPIAWASLRNLVHDRATFRCPRPLDL